MTLDSGVAVSKIKQKDPRGKDGRCFFVGEKGKAAMTAGGQVGRICRKKVMERHQQPMRGRRVYMVVN